MITKCMMSRILFIHQLACFALVFIDRVAIVGSCDRDGGLSHPLVLLASQIACVKAPGDNQRAIGGTSQLAKGQRRIPESVPETGQSHVLRTKDAEESQILVP